MCAVGGLEAQTETVWQQADNYKIPRLVFVNKLDRVGADFENVLNMIEKKLNVVALPLQYPIGYEDKFQGIVDLLTETSYIWPSEGDGQEFVEKEIPDNLKEYIKTYREELVIKLAENDEIIEELYLNGKEITIDDLILGIRRACQSLKVFPVLCGAAFKNKGVQMLLDSVVKYLPSPLDVPSVKAVKKGKEEETFDVVSNKDQSFIGLAFKISMDPFFGQLAYLRIYSGKVKVGQTILNVNKGKKEKVSRLVMVHSNHKSDIKIAEAGDIVAIIGTKFTQTGDTLGDLDSSMILESVRIPDPVMRVAIEPKTKADEGVLLDSIGKILKEDPSFKYYEDEQTGQKIIAGMGELHLEIITDRLLREYKVQGNVGKPYVNYKETIIGECLKEYEYEKGTESKLQYAYLMIKIKPADRGKYLVFENKCENKKVPDKFVKAIKEGIEQSMSYGPLGGYESCDFIVELIDLKFDPENSSESAFKIAASMLFKDCFREAKPVLLEPIMKTEILTPDSFLGDVIGDVNQRRGKVKKIECVTSGQKINVSIPLAEMFGYSNSLRSLTQGRGNFTMEFDRYELMPEELSSVVLGRNL